MAVEIKAKEQTFDHGQPQALFESRSDVGSLSSFFWGYQPSADGKRFLISMTPGGGAEAAPLTVVVNWLGGVKP